MKIWAIAMIAVLTIQSLKAQKLEVEAGADIVSSYVWRGTQFAGASIQPGITFSTGGLSFGAWGSTGFDGVFQEADLFISYDFDFGLSFGLTNYYFPGTDYFDFSRASGAHGFEANLGYSLEDFSISANYILNEAGGAATAGGDMYFELGYALGSVNLFAGLGNGWHTPGGDFGFTNIGINTSKELKITDSFSLPISASAILNPTTKQFYIVGAITL